MSYSIYKSDQPFALESGNILQGYHLAYTTYGSLNAAKDNVVWIFHALTANSEPVEWWPGLVGDGKLFDPEKYFIICVNMPGSCYGSIGPLDINKETGKTFYHDFPFFTPRDMIRSYQPLKDYLGIDKIKIGIGGSMGGQQLLEWAIEEPGLFEYIFPVATNAIHSAWGVAFNASQRMCIDADETWKQRNKNAGMKGMKAARSIALISYRHYETYHASQSGHENERIENFKSESYQKYQGEKLAKRFNAFSYYVLSKGMDSHNVGRGRGGVEIALHEIKAKTLAIGIETDILFPVAEQKFIAANIPNGKFVAINSLYGHDGFLLEAEQIQHIISNFLAATKQTKILN
ncbi:homoserine O-acetyltransferase family protein [Ginsengibacter hankyongi]|uniref:homoserine O-acetyltransferase family protein n=1 Tax=Ginsengibacter hankyongi TaxID=2607284 RepID=UPI001F1E0968|nr:homoserine O-acetyltransferase [Ginsengibacter hankyongi]